MTRHRIPADTDGRVPEWAVYAHMLDADNWSSTGKRRSVSADRAKAGPVIHVPEGDGWTAEELRSNGWWDSVNGSDLIGVDDGTSYAFRTFGSMDAGLRSVFSRIAVIADPVTQERIVSAMDASFTRSELELMARAGLVIQVGDHDGRYNGAYMERDPAVGTAVVLLDRGFDDGTLVHELMRHLDALQGMGRDPPYMVAETVIRTMSPTAPPYYDGIGGQTAYAEDMGLLAPKGKRMKGKRATARVGKVLPGTAARGFREERR